MNRKYILICFLLSISNIITATDYYVSSSNTSANDLNNGTSPTTPWKTISKVNSMFSSLQPGDRILFNRGDTFYGTITISRSGSSANPITVGAYGTGSNPIISGFSTLSGWVNSGSNIWQVTLITSITDLNMVIINGKQFGMGRYPNSTFLSYESHLSNTTITDNQLTGSPDWTGAEVVMRKNRWMLDRSVITNHSGTTLTYTSGSTWTPTDGFGYFIQKDIKTLDEFGEWFYKSSGKTFMLYSIDNPSKHVIKVSTLDINVNINDKDYIDFENLTFEGANKYGFLNVSGQQINIRNCNINFSGIDGIFTDPNSINAIMIIEGVTINHANECGIHLRGTNSYAWIKNNRIRNISTIPGAGTNSDNSGDGIAFTGSNTLIEYNTIDSVGHSGIRFHGGSNIIVRNNYINGFALTRYDAGGIYSWNKEGVAPTGQKIQNNIILNGKSSSDGIGGSTVLSVWGIYLDEHSVNIEITGNTVYNCPTAGLLIYYSGKSIAKNNTFYSNGHQIQITSPTSGIQLDNNIYFAKLSSQFAFNISTSATDISKILNSDKNYYLRPIDDDEVFMTYQPTTGTKYRTLPGWQLFSNLDSNSYKSPIAITDVNTILFEYNATKTDKIVTLSKPMIDITGKKYTGSVTLAPYTSVILMVDPNPAQTMTPVYQSSVIENATPSILTMTYDQTLANIIPLATAFKVIVNSSERIVTKVSISGTKVQLTLASPVVFGDKVTVEYIKPSSGPVLQATSGDPAESIPAQNVTNNVNPPNPEYISSVVENVTPSRIDITYNLSLKTVSISPSAFTVKVNTITRTVSSVSISGTKVLLNLASPVAYGDLVTVAYTKPSTNFIQTPDGGQAVSFTAKTVTNNVSPAAPVYVSSVIEDTTPSLLEMTFNMSLTNIVPVNSAFTVTVNSSVSSLISVSVSGTKVNLSLANPVEFGDIVTVAYSKPASGQLQASSGAQVASFTAQPVTNNCTDPAQTLFPPVIVTNYEPNAFSGKVYEIDASGSTDANNDILTFSWSAPSNVDLSSNSGSKIRFLAPVVTTAEVITIGLSVSDGTTVQSKNLPVNILPYKPDLAMGKVDIVEASNSYSTDYPDKAIDGDPDTKWSMEGDNHWLRFDMPLPFKISHLLLSFLPDQNFESYFDIFASVDKKSWEPVLLNAKSCDFSGGPQIFDFPLNKTSTDYTSVKLVGHGNSLNSWNYFSEFKLFGSPGEAPDTISVTPESIYIYPNPASEFINVLVLEPFEKAQNLRIIDFSGRLCQEILLEPGLNNIKVPLNLKPGIYVTQVILGKLITFSQKLLVSH